MRWPVVLALVFGLLALTYANMEDCVCTCDCPDPPTEDCTTPTPKPPPDCLPSSVCDAFLPPSILAGCDDGSLGEYYDECVNMHDDTSWLTIFLYYIIDVFKFIIMLLGAILELVAAILAALQVVIDCLLVDACSELQIILTMTQELIDNTSGAMEALADILAKLDALCDSLMELKDRLDEMDCTTTTVTAGPLTVDCDCTCTCPTETLPCTTTEEPTTTTVSDTTTTPTTTTTTDATTTTTCNEVTECDSFTDVNSPFYLDCADCLDDILINAMIEDCDNFSGDDALLAAFIANIQAICEDQTGTNPTFPTSNCD